MLISQCNWPQPAPHAAYQASRPCLPDKARDPDMHQTRKGNQWYFGMKAHIGVDSKSKVIHSVAVTAANVHDSQVPGDLLHGEETRVWGDSAYTGQGAVSL